jgi:DNA repair protein RadB
MIKTGNEALDSFLELKEGINLIYGEAATGKTTLALMAALEEAKYGKVVFIDTENGFNVDRLKQLNPSGKDRLENILLFTVKSLKEQLRRIEQIERLNEINLIIIDTIGMFYRVEVRKDSSKANKLIDKQLQSLSILSTKGIKILINNQVYSKMDGGINTVGGEMIKNWSKKLIRLDKDPRMICIEKPFSKSISFRIVDQGLLI